MQRGDRLFEIIQILRSANRPVTAADLARRLELSERTIYRDIAALQARRTPIDGAAGVGYILRKSYDLPALNFDPDEVEAIIVGLSLLSRTGDAGLQRAAARVARKINLGDETASRFKVSPFGVDGKDSDRLIRLRQAIRHAQSLEITYEKLSGDITTRKIKPLAVIYFAEVNLLAAFCETKQDFRHFRVDRISEISRTEGEFRAQAKGLRDQWHAANRFEMLDAPPI